MSQGAYMRPGRAHAPHTWRFRRSLIQGDPPRLGLVGHMIRLEVRR